MTEPLLTIVIPVRDEAGNIRAMLEGLHEQVRCSYEVVLVHDSEEDDTLPVARAVAKELSLPLRLVRNERGPGALNAIWTGLHSARTELVVLTMADLCDPPEVINAMVDVALAAPADVVCASRYAAGGRQHGGPLVKGLLSRVAGTSLKLLTSVPTSDATNSFKLYRRRVIQELEVESTGGFEIGIELVVKAHFAGFTVAEVPTTWRDRTAGTSRFKLWAWLPRYLRWYRYALRAEWWDGRGGRAGGPAEGELP